MGLECLVTASDYTKAITKWKNTRILFGTTCNPFHLKDRCKNQPDHTVKSPNPQIPIQQPKTTSDQSPGNQIVTPPRIIIQTNQPQGANNSTFALLALAEFGTETITPKSMNFQLLHCSTTSYIFLHVRAHPPFIRAK